MPISKNAAENSGRKKTKKKKSKASKVDEYSTNSTSSSQTTVTKPKGVRSEKTAKVIAALDVYFTDVMKVGEVKNNHDLVKYLDQQGLEATKAAIPTDIPLNYAPKTEALKSGRVVKEKDDPEKKRAQWQYRRLE